MLSPSIRTEQATGLSRSPWQTGQGRVSPSSRLSKERSAARSASSWESKSFAEGTSVQTSPKPRQCSHQPWGELNEKRRGSSSSKARPQSVQFISELRMRNSGTVDFFLPLVALPPLGDFVSFGAGEAVAGRAFAVPLPISRARLVRSSSPFLASLSIVPTSTSMVCSLKRSSGWNPSTSVSSPSTSRVVNP